MSIKRTRAFVTGFLTHMPSQWSGHARWKKGFMLLCCCCRTWLKKVMDKGNHTDVEAVRTPRLPSGFSNGVP